jgi:hypothetical protein
VTTIDTSNRRTHALALSALTALQSAALSRRGMIALAVLLLGLGLAFNWSWLVAVGAAPLILAVLPCVAMCGLGLCMAGHNHAPAEAPTRSDEANAGAAKEAERSCCKDTTKRV